MKARAATAAAATVLALALAAPSAAHAQSYSRADYVTAARMLNAWRFEEARELIEELAEKEPDATPARYLRAELAFLDGDYLRSVDLLQGIADEELDGNVGQLRALASSTSQATKGFVSRESAGGHFVIFYSPGKDEVIVDLAGEVLESAYAAVGDDLGVKPARKVRVELLGRPADLARVSTLTAREIETTGTIALCKYGKLMVVTPRATMFGYPWMDTLVHEYVHYLVSTASHDHVPVWLHEGLAKFEQVRWRRPADGKLSAGDEHLLATALEKDKLISFDDMHPSMAKLPSQEAAALAFAEVFTMVAFLQQKVGYQGIRALITLQKDGKGARDAAAEVMGKSWREVEASWRQYLQGAGLRTSPRLTGRAGHAIRFRKGGEENDENAGLDQVSSDKARKFTRLGGILRSRGHAAAAAVEYEKALAIVGPSDPFVAAKLSRTYLELGKHDKAIGLAAPLAAEDENDAAPATTLGLARLASGDASGASTALEQALRIAPFDPAVRCGLAEAYSALGREKEATREQRACQRLKR